jgi:hypothetical protein
MLFVLKGYERLWPLQKYLTIIFSGVGVSGDGSCRKIVIRGFESNVERAREDLIRRIRML